MNKKIAVCISGELRYFDNPFVIEGFKKFLSIYEPDIFISTWDHIGASMNHSYIDPSQQKNVDETILKRIENVYVNTKKVKVENYNDWFASLDEIKKNRIYFGDYNPQTVNSYTQMYKISDSIRMKLEYEIENNFKYDIVIRIRPDNLFVNHFNFSINPNTIYNINFGNAFYPNRIYDILFYGDSYSMDRMSECYDNFENLMNYPFNNGLCRRDATRILFLQAKLSNLDVVSTNNRMTDTFRGTSFNEYYEYIKKIGEYNNN